MISVLHPSRGRPEKSVETFKKWMSHSRANEEVEFILSLDEDEPTDHPYIKSSKYITLYNAAMFTHGHPYKTVVSKNRSAVDAINNAARVSTGDVLIVVSDDTDPCDAWIEYIYHEANGKTDWIMKTQDGIQPWIITMPVMDRAYYERTRNVYSPDFKHMFCDTWLTVMADLSGRKITSTLKFPHLNDSIKDDVRKRSDATWEEGERMFIHKIQQLPTEDLRKIQDRNMKNWIRNKTGRYV